jgi:hypothetical protein
MESQCEQYFGIPSSRSWSRIPVTLFYFGFKITKHGPCTVQVASIWTAEEIGHSVDHSHFQQLSADEQQFIANVLPFFAAAEGNLVNDNLLLNFASAVQSPEAPAASTTASRSP